MGGIGVGMAPGTGVLVGVVVGVAVAAATGVAVGRAAETENKTATDRSLFMTTVACSPTLLSTAVQATPEPGTETTNVTMVPGS